MGCSSCLYERSKMKRWSLALFGLLILVPGAVQAAGVYGPSGLFLHTTAYLPPKGPPTVGATYFTQVRRTPAGERTITWVPVFIDTRLGDRVEAGAVYLHQRFQGDTLSSYGGFAKYQILPERQRAPAVAVDAEIISGDLRQSAVNLVASQELSRREERPLRLHVGWTLHRRSDLQGPEGRFDETDNAPFAGVEVGIAKNLRFVAEAEARLKFYPEAATAVGLMWTPSPQVGLAVGWVNTGRSTESRFFIGVGYRVRSVD
jgi:hypothetical protein